jgi:hypothetical protein
VPPRVNIAERVLFDAHIRKILKEFDSYARAERAKGCDPTVAQFHALRGEKLRFSADSLKRWLSLRKRYGER